MNLQPSEIPTDLLLPGSNCWRCARAERARVLVDAATYFEALASALERAQKSIIILGWDLDSRTRLLCEPHPRNLPTQFGDFLNAVVSRRRGLQAYLLSWDYSMIYALEREPLPVYKLGTRTHRRIKFHLDDAHPITASHHQKIVVIDDRVAFVGGLDITVRRWDTRAHRPHDPHRVDPGGVEYRPFHDIQMVVDGDAARALGELARERWRRATGETLSVPPATDYDPWPLDCVPDFTDVDIAIARTEPRYNGYAEVAEVKQLYLDSIAAAQHSIYIENQYFTAASISAALAQRLRAASGPEVIIVLPLGNGGWLEEATMGLLRARIMRELHQADRHGRLRIFYSALRDREHNYVQIHSKVMVVDDRLLRVGSSNLNNRSMGFDTECDLAIEGKTPALQAAIARIRNELLAEHLGTDAGTVADAHRDGGSLIGAIDRLRGGSHSLEPLLGELPEQVELPEPLLVDPERPVGPEELVAEFVPEEVRNAANPRLLRNTLLLLAVFALVAAWHWTPLGQWLNIRQITEWTDALAAHPWGPAILLATFVLSGFILIPVSLLIIATAFSFDTAPAMLYAMGGCLMSAAANYYLGRALGENTVRRIAGPRLRRIQKHLIHRGLITVIALRLLPVAPFSVINIVTGALRIRFRHLMLGSFIGLTPGILGITVFTGGIASLLRRPSLSGLVLLALFVVLAAAIALWLRRWLAPLEESTQEH